VAVSWSVLGPTQHGVVLMATEGATLLLETARPSGMDPELCDAIARLAPHLTFGPVTMRGDIVERVAISETERVVIGCLTRGASSIAYVIAARVPIDIDDLLAERLPAGSPFEHLID
jgi:hypothetical protein